ncbi:MAG TPA: TetR/AcrR family transcriptional regulator [Mycobacteriales bacterium]|nr:TetR/AcrR family transcriptional regulator [Mycobacteriales bacterium]
MSAEPIPSAAGADPAAVSLDRRQRRRLETIEEVLDVAAAVMAEQGVAGLSVGEVARRMGIRPPSLYVYFDSKGALYDALFERGWRLLNAHLEQTRTQVLDHGTLEDALVDTGSAFVRWAIENPAYSQLLFWRPVPGFEPSPEAYAPAVRSLDGARQLFGELQQRGLLRADASIDEVTRDWTIVLAGIVSQQLSNAPREPFDSGTYTAALPGLVAMFTRHYGPTPPSKPTRRARHGDSRRSDR